jgi:hypothetical protein
MTTPKPVKDRVIIQVIAVRLPKAVITAERQPAVTPLVIHNSELGPGEAVSTSTARA